MRAKAWYACFESSSGKGAQYAFIVSSVIFSGCIAESLMMAGVIFAATAGGRRKSVVRNVLRITSPAIFCGVRTADLNSNGAPQSLTTQTKFLGPQALFRPGAFR